MLDVKIKILKKEGKENIIYKFVIVFEDLIKLKILSVVFLLILFGLMRNVWFYIIFYWCCWGW